MSLITDLESTDVLDKYFAQFLIPADQGSPASALSWIAPPDWSKVQNQVVAPTFAVKERKTTSSSAAAATNPQQDILVN